MPAAKSRRVDEASAEAASGYIASEAHYLSAAGRILAALRGGPRLVLVAGSPPADPEPLSQALRKLAGSRHKVIGIPCGPELTSDELARAGSIVATLPAGGGMVTLSDTADTASALFVFDKADRLSGQQIEEICAALQPGGRQNAAAVLLASAEFLARLEKQPLQLGGEALAASLRFDEIGDDEGIDFLRHQLAARHREDETRRVRPIFMRALTVVGVLSAVVVGVIFALHYAKQPDLKTPEHSAPSAGSPSTEITAPQPAPASRAAPAATALPPVPEAPKPPAAPALPIPAPPPPEKIPEPTASFATPDPARDAKARQAPPGSVQPPPGGQLSPAEITALVARGDGFLRAGDIASARLFYERAADAGSGGAALRLGATFDPNFLGRAGIHGNLGDPAQAASWYRRALDLGDPAATESLKKLDEQRR